MSFLKKLLSFHQQEITTIRGMVRMVPQNITTIRGMVPKKPKGLTLCDRFLFPFLGNLDSTPDLDCLVETCRA